MINLDELSFGKTKRQHIKEFGLIFGLLFGILCLFFHSYILFSLTLIFPILGYFAPIVLSPFWSAWMKFAHILGNFVTKLLLTITWFMIITPIAIMLKLFGKKVIDASFNRSQESYWEDRPDNLHNFKLLERQF